MTTKGHTTTTTDDALAQAATDPTTADPTTAGAPPADPTSADASASGPPGGFVPPTVRRTPLRRRPSGSPPPLPRSLGASGKAWLVTLALLIVWVTTAAVSSTVRRGTNRIDASLLRGIARLRTDWLTNVARAVDRIGSGWAVTVIGAALIVLLLVFRRWRHIFTFLGCVVVLLFFGGRLLYEPIARPRPYDVTVIGRWGGYSFPSPPVAVLLVFLVAVLYSAVVPGRPRSIAKAVVSAVIIAYAGSRLYLAIDHPSDIIVGGAIAMALTVNAFRFFTPNEVFPVTYHKGKTAHLDVGGRRGEAIRRAVQDELGVTVVDMKPVGLAGSGGSTPLRLRVAGDPDRYLFGKLYAMNHVRADRWYKAGRTILYGRLEDEAPFQSVRRLVEYEDYTLRLLRDSGIPTAEPSGIVELTPEREYLLVTEFFDGAVEIGEADVDDDIIDQGLMLVRRMWDSGVAHRDIKPANLMVRDRRLLLIDTAFAQVRPSPWRQAVDLANMMLVLGVRTDAERVYRRALQFFTPDEIAEAFAATRGAASPTQLRAVMKQDGRNLVDQFRALAPARRAISLQRWGVRRVIYVFALLIGAIVVAQNVAGLLRPTYDIGVDHAPTCGTENVMILMAQTVPSATSVPCIASLPAGWTLGGVEVSNNRGSFWLNSDKAGTHAIRVSLLRPQDCDVRKATQVPSDEAGTKRFEQPEQLPPDLVSTRYYLFPGGCVLYRLHLRGAASGSLVLSADATLALEPRARLVDKVATATGLRLCGAGAACPGGS
jgi:tRNA A-37 threonylcarbamoyl transferase component Bud32